MLQIKMLLFSCSVLICARISRLEISVSYFHCIYTSQTRLHLKTYVIVPIWFLRKYFHDFGFDVGRPISTLPPKCIALFWKTLDLQNMHQFLSTSEPIRLHQTRTVLTAVYTCISSIVIRHHFHQVWHLYFKAWCICATWHFPNDMPSH